MLNTLRLIRPINLLMIALSMLLVRYCLILPAFETVQIATGISPEHLDRWMFLALTVGTCLIAAAGNIINDRFDTTADAINKPGKNIVGTAISHRSAENSYRALSIIGSLPGIYLGFRIGKPALALLLPFCAFSLWMYSSHYKRSLLSGNLMIAFLTLVMVILPGLFEPEFYPNIIYLLNYGILAFLLTMAREIVKDIEDQEGDLAMECRTLPIRYGKKMAAITASGFILLAASYGCFVSWKYFQGSSIVNWMNVSLVLCLPLFVCTYLLLKADDRKDYCFTSSFLKGYLAIGMLTMLPFWYYFLR